VVLREYCGQEIKMWFPLENSGMFIPTMNLALLTLAKIQLE
jgi:hypothetical protein